MVATSTGIIEPEPRADGRGVPHALNRLIGRGSELACVQQLVGEARLVTLTGPGGVGKTRLALEAARSLQGSFRQGACLVDLAGVPTSSHVERAFANAFNIQEEAGRSLQDLVTERVSRKAMLVLIDNCEHVLEGCATLAQAILAASPEVHLLLTSREPLRLPGERTLRVRPLPLANPATETTLSELAQVPSIQLFVERAQEVEAEFELSDSNADAVVEICRRLDGLPLALELAAARASVLSAQQIASQMTNRLEFLVAGSPWAPPRQRTLRAAIGWSYELLSTDERHALQRLSVFVGSFTLDAAEAVCAGQPPGTYLTLHVIAALVGKSLVNADTTGPQVRYRLLQTVRHFAQDECARDGHTECATCLHATYFAEQLARAAAQWHGPDQGRWLRWIAEFEDDVVAALAWFGAHSPSEGLCAATGLTWYWQRRGQLNYGRSVIEALLAAGPSDAAVRAKAHVSAAQLAFSQGDLAAARQFIDAAIPAARLAGERHVVVVGLSVLCRLLNRQGDTHGSRACAAHCITLMRGIEAEPDLTGALLNIAIAAAERGDEAESRSVYQEVIQRARRCGDLWSLALASRSLGHIERVRSNYAAARALFEEALEIWRGFDDQWGIAWSLSGLAYLALDEGDSATAGALFRECLLARRELSANGSVANSLEGFASLASACGQPIRAMRLAGAAMAIRDGMGERPPEAEVAAFERTLTAARNELGPKPALVAYENGRRMSLVEACDLALDAGADALDGAQGDGHDLESQLTTREREVYALLGRGCSNKEIADTLVIGVRTAETHVERVLRKLGLESRAQATLRFRLQHSTRRADPYTHP